MHHVDRRVGQRQRLRAAERARRRRPAAGYDGGPARQVGVRLDADDRRAVAANARQVEAGAAADVEHGRAGPVGRPRASRPRSARRGRRRGSRARRSPGGARCSGWGRPASRRARRDLVPDSAAFRRTRHRPDRASDPDEAVRGLDLRGDDAGGAVRGDPLDLTSSSGASTVSPSHSLTRCGSPAISRQARENVAGRRRRSGAARPGSSHSMKNGSCGSAIRPLTPICFQRSSVPSGRCRLPATASRPSRCSTGGDVVDRHDPAQPAAAEGGAGPDRLAERAPCRTRGGRAPRRPRGRCASASGRIMLRVPNRGWTPPSTKSLPSSPPMRWAVPARPSGPAA